MTDLFQSIGKLNLIDLLDVLCLLVTVPVFHNERSGSGCRKLLQVTFSGREGGHLSGEVGGGEALVDHG